MLFNRFSKIPYDNLTITNIITSLSSIYKEVEKEFTLQEYTIKGAPRPEQLAYTLYNNPNYEWTLLLVNDIIDPFHGWVRHSDTIYQTAEILYKNEPEGINSNHHHYDPETDEVYYDLVEYPNESKMWYHTGDIDHERVQFVGDLVPVTNIEYELEKNEDMRDILIVAPNHIERFVTRITGLLNERNNTRY